MGAKKKRTYNTFSETRKGTNLGEIQDHNIQRNALPPVGSYVIVMEEHCLSDNHVRNGVVSFYEPVTSSAYTDAYGNIYVFEVMGYSLGEEKIFDPRNLVSLRHYYKADKTQGHMNTTVRVVDVAVGNMRLDIVRGATVSTIDPDDVRDRQANCNRRGVSSREAT